MASSTTNPRLPTASDFPSHITLSITPPPPSTSPLRSALLLLHGLGDTHAPFTALASQLRLPHTAILSLQAPHPLPALFTGSEAPSFHWGDDVLFDGNTGALDLDAGFGRVANMVWQEVVLEGLVRRCGFELRDVMFYGFGQGGMVALAIAGAGRVREVEMAAVVSVGGRLPARDLELAMPRPTDSASAEGASSGAGSGSSRLAGEASLEEAEEAEARSDEGARSHKSKTPVLLLGGSRSREVTQSAVLRVKERFAEVEYVKWKKNEDSMPGSREEMLPLMRIFARRLGRMKSPAGAMEI